MEWLEVSNGGNSMSEQATPSTEDQPSGNTRPLDFSTFLLSLGTSALIQLGEAPDPTTGNDSVPDLPAARQTIDLLGLLEEKTQGNLNESENHLLRHLLRDLRLHYLSKTGS
jgi:hypothetical protein